MSNNKRSKTWICLVLIISTFVLGFFIGRCSVVCPPSKECPEIERNSWIHEDDLRTVLDERNG